MSKQPTNDIYELIKALSKSEKRYFKLFAMRHKRDEGDMIKLFDIIEAKPLLTEKEILLNYSFGHFPMLKKRLYEAIIKSLEDFYAEHSINTVLRSELTRTEILIKKGLFSQAQNILEKLKQKAEKNEKFPILLEVYRLEEEIIRSEGDNFISEDQIAEKIMEQKNILGIYNNLLDYTELNNILYYNRRVGFIRNKLWYKKYETFLKQKALSSESAAKSFEAKFLFNYINSVIYIIQQKNEKALQYFKAIISLYESNPHRIEENPERYIYSNANYFSALFFLKHKKEFLEHVNKLLSSKLSNNEYGNDVKYVCYDQLMYFHCHFGEFEKSAEIFEKLTAQVDEKYINQRKLHRLKYYMHGVVIFFGTGDYKKSIGWVNKILNDPDSITTRKDIYLYAKLMAVFNYFELKEEQVLSYELLSLYRHLKKLDALNKFEQILVKAIRKSAFDNTPDNLRNYFIEVKKEFDELNKDSFESQALNNINIIHWLESKIEKKSYADILKKKRA